MLITLRTKYGTYPDCTVEFGRYHTGGRVAISLMDDEGPVATATVNIPDFDLREGEVLIKDYNENAGMLASLVEAGVVTDTGRRLSVGFVENGVAVARLTTEARAAADAA